MMDSICFIDMETTGVNLYKDYPIQLGAVLVDMKERVVKKEFVSLIRPPRSLSSTMMALSIHGIKDEQLSDAPQIEDVLRSFFAELGTDFSFGGWNICFDVGFFRRVCFETDKIDSFHRINHRHLDVQSVAQFLRSAGVLPANLQSLSDFGSHFDLVRSTQHNALEDACLAWRVYDKLLKLI